MTVPDKTRVRAAYDLAAEHFDDPAVGFWARIGARTIERLDPRPGWQLLDIGCGTGSSALPAAQRVGPAGRVLGIDISEEMVARARAKAASRGLSNAEFRVGDLMALDLPEAGFDAVVSVFSIFSDPDMAGRVRGLKRLLRPGGRLAVTSWGAHVFAPVAPVWWEAVRRERPDLWRGAQPWDSIADADSLRRMLAEGGLPDAEVALEPGRQPLAAPEDFWAVVQGTGYRWIAERLDPGARTRLRESVVGWIRDNQVSGLETNVLYAVAEKG